MTDESQAARIIRHFGGPTRLTLDADAHGLGLTLAAVKKWRTRGAVPDYRHHDLTLLARITGREPPPFTTTETA